MSYYKIHKNHFCLRFGFSGEYAPRCIIRSEVRCKKTDQIRQIIDYQNEKDLYDLLVDFLHILYFKYALFSPKDKPIVVVESLLTPTLFRETLAKVCFNIFVRIFSINYRCYLHIMKYPQC